MRASVAPTVKRFGVFEADARTEELRKEGLCLRLPGQSFRVLLLLLENPGEMVTREVLRKTLWPEDTFVDFDHGLNAAVNRLREALGDSADHPKFIETLPRRGYRFIGTINNHENKSASVVAPPKGDPAFEKVAALDAARPDADINFRWIGVLAVVTVVLAIAAMLVWLRLPPVPPRVLATTQLTSDGVQKLGLLTDGSRLYITETKGTSQFLVQASVAGGETSTIPTTFPDVSLVDISPDHSRLLVETNDLGRNGKAEFWALPLPSGPPLRVADVTGSDGGWSPDGRRLVFARGDDVYLAKADGTDARKLFTMADGASDLRFSPDSNRIRFNARKDNSMSIWEIRTDGTNLHPMLSGWRNPPSECCGVWSPNGRYYFFLRNTPAGGNIWVLQESNSVFRKHDSGPFQLTAGPMLFRTLTPSADGKKLFVDGFQARGELIRYDAQRRGFVPFLSGISASDLRFSRDGKWVAYVSYPEGTLWRSRVDGSDRLQVTSPPVIAALPHWSPDGTQIAFEDLQTGLRKIFLVSANGGVAHELLAENLDQSDPEWSPDGKQIVFAHLSRNLEQVSIQLLDLNSKQVSIVPGSQGLFSPRWSPDGRYLAALPCDSTKIVIFDSKSQKWSDWVSGPGLRGFPAWSRGGQYLYFDTYATEAPGYYRVKLGQSRPELVVDLKDLKRNFGQEGTWSGLTPDDSPLFLRDVSTDEIYTLDLELP